MRAGAAAGEWTANHVTRRRPIADREAARHAESALPVSSDKAVKELGYRPRPARVTLARAVRWFLDSGLLDPGRARLVRERGRFAAVLDAHAAAAASTR